MAERVVRYVTTSPEEGRYSSTHLTSPVHYEQSQPAYLEPTRVVRMVDERPVSYVESGGPPRVVLSPPPPPRAEEKDDSVSSASEFQNGDFWRAVVAEFIATSFYVGFSVAGMLSSGVAYSGSASANHAFNIIYHIFLVLILIYTFGPLSGAHFNPAVTFGALLARRITIVRFFFYGSAQVIGALVGAGIMKGCFMDDNRKNLAIFKPTTDVHDGSAFLMEFFITFAYVFVIFAVAFDKRGWGKLAPTIVALVAGLNMHAASSITGGAMNPIRPFGPAAVMNDIPAHWVYWVGCMIGGGMAGIVHEYLFMEREQARVNNVPSLAADSEHSKKTL
eukprot:CAMPEP_0114548666 /NCGR_PEP_ID=MMETSP0114-20121206/5107_1 /TAXON_ID=31324 /ORGANISM="Goniomonas sp, Strain m" /LENGTH=333 /DNA_ID=CAMNT_0001733279 /DNA_START=1 /DNA_END=1002 /DNA_ORIENTATION=-